MTQWYSSVMVFNKLISDGPRLPPRSTSGEEDEDLVPPPPTLPGGQTKSWESLLSWMPTYHSFSGVFKDIAELPFATPNSSLDMEQCRPTPLGEGRPPEERTAQEQYI